MSPLEIIVIALLTGLLYLTWHFSAIFLGKVVAFMLCMIYCYSVWKLAWWISDKATDPCPKCSSKKLQYLKFRPLMGPFEWTQETCAACDHVRETYLSDDGP